MTAAVRSLVVFLAFATLLIAPFRTPAGEAEVYMNLRMAAYQRGDYRCAAASSAFALKEAETFGETDQRFTMTFFCFPIVRFHDA